MRIRIDETIKYYNNTHTGKDKLSQRKLAKIAMPDTEITASQMYLIKLNRGNFGPKTSVNMDVIHRIMNYTGVDVEFLMEFEK
jgi:hypothetical protein